MTFRCLQNGIVDSHVIAGEHCAVNNPPPQDIENYDPDFGQSGWTYNKTATNGMTIVIHLKVNTG
jgi:hypothetical protein